jgi:hypothetical protein
LEPYCVKHVAIDIYPRLIAWVEFLKLRISVDKQMEIGLTDIGVWNEKGKIDWIGKSLDGYMYD